MATTGDQDQEDLSAETFSYGCNNCLTISSYLSCVREHFIDFAWLSAASYIQRLKSYRSSGYWMTDVQVGRTTRIIGLQVSLTYFSASACPQYVSRIRINGSRNSQHQYIAQVVSSDDSRKTINRSIDLCENCRSLHCAHRQIARNTNARPNSYPK